jgi:hypothetical protein
VAGRECLDQEAGLLSGDSSPHVPDHPFYGKGQGGGARRVRFYLWCFPFFLPQKNQKNGGICSEIVQKKLVGHLGE